MGVVYSLIFEYIIIIGIKTNAPMKIVFWGPILSAMNPAKGKEIIAISDINILLKEPIVALIGDGTNLWNKVIFAG